MEQFCTEADKQLSGELALLIGSAIRHQNLDELRAAIRQVAIDVDDTNAKWIFATVQNDLPDECKEWFENAIVQIRGGEDG